MPHNQIAPMLYQTRELSKLVVPEHLVIPFVSFFAGALVVLRAIPPLKISILTIGAFGFLVLGFNTSNPLFDIDTDRINKPKKATVTKTINKKVVAISAVLFYLIGNILAVTIKPTLLLVTLTFTILSIVYSAPPIRLKSRFLLTNFTGGTLYGFLLFVATAVVFNAAVPWGIFLFFMLLTTILTSCKDFEDYKGDKKNNIYTIPVIFGIKKGAQIISVALLLLFGIMYALIYAQRIDRALIYPTMISTVFAILFVIKLLRETKRYKVHKNLIYQSSLARGGMAIGLLIEVTYGIAYVVYA